MLQKRIDDHAPPTREAMREAEDIFYKHLKRVGLKHTDQRDAILHTFLETVYRTLKLLAECGLASEVAFHDGVTRYEHQFNRRSHHHMVCTECNASVEFFSPEAGKLSEDIARKFRFDATRHTFQIYGICEDCRKMSKKPV
jgi:Fur family ferric uptake transcriptional regulator